MTERELRVTEQKLEKALYQLDVMKELHPDKDYSDIERKIDDFAAYVMSWAVRLDKPDATDTEIASYFR